MRFDTWKKIEDEIKGYYPNELTISKLNQDFYRLKNASEWSPYWKKEAWSSKENDLWQLKQELDVREAEIKKQEEKIGKEWEKIEMGKNEIVKIKNELYENKDLSDILQM